MTMADGRYRIAEVADRTGFTTPTLRYYEEIGLLPPAERTPAGYRVYDDRAIARLRFVARAKQLGCTLEEITDLAEAWDRDECAPVKHRLRGLVDEKLAEVEARLAELRALRADLRAAAEVLESAPLDGPCDESCGCAGARGDDRRTKVVPLTEKARRVTEPASVREAKRLLPLYDDAAPIVCTISDGDRADHLARLERLRAGATSIERTDTGLLLQLPRTEEMRADVHRFVADEKTCCTFWGFAVVEGDDEIVLRWDGPPNVGVQLEAVERALRGDEPLESIDGLL